MVFPTQSSAFSSITSPVPIVGDVSTLSLHISAYFKELSSLPTDQFSSGYQKLIKSFDSVVTLATNLYEKVLLHKKIHVDHLEKNNPVLCRVGNDAYVKQIESITKIAGQILRSSKEHYKNFKDKKNATQAGVIESYAKVIEELKKLNDVLGEVLKQSQTTIVE